MFRVALALLAASCGRLEFERENRAADATIDAQDCTIANGLVGHWTMNAGDVTSTQLVDRSGHGFHGTLNGSPRPVGVDDSLDFTATTTAWVEMSNIPFDTTAGGFNTVSAWFWNSDPDVDDSVFYLPHAGGAQPPRYDLWLNFGRIDMVSLCINTGSSDCWGISDPGLLGRWVHVVAVLVNGRIDGGTLYIDGVASTMSCRFGTCDTERTAMTPFTLGGPDATYAWSGKLDEVRIYNRALTGAEASQLYACGR